MGIGLKSVESKQSSSPVQCSSVTPHLGDHYYVYYVHCIKLGQAASISMATSCICVVKGITLSSLATNYCMFIPHRITQFTNHNFPHSNYLFWYTFMFLYQVGVSFLRREYPNIWTEFLQKWSHSHMRDIFPVVC